MKDYRFLALLLALVLLFSLISCKNNDPHGDGGNGGEAQDQHDNTEGQQQGGEGQVTYVYSVVSKTLHLPNCYHIDRMNEDYKFEYTGSITVLLEKGYTICRDCLVPDTEEEEEPAEDDTNKVAKEDATFVINSASKMLHTLDCHHVEVIVEKNIQYTDLTLEELIALDEYEPCAVCLPDEAEEYDKNHPDDEK